MDDFMKLIKLKQLLRGFPIQVGIGLENIFDDDFLDNLTIKGIICRHEGYWRLLE